jgi:PAS domain S-box-containing protein
VHLAGALIAAAILALDLRLAISVGSLYVLVILLGLWTAWRPYPIVATLAACALTLADAAFGPSPGAEDPLVAFIEWPFMVLAFAVTGVFVARHTRLQHESRERLEQLTSFKEALDHAAIVATTGVDGRITYVNDKFCEVSGFSREELLGQDHRLVNSGHHSAEFMRGLWTTIANGRVWHGELRNRAKDGHWYWVETTIVPFLNERGKPYQYIAIRADVTARKVAEEKLARQDALARLGQMAAVVAHEVRNPLAGIKGAIQILISRRQKDDGELPLLRDIVSRIDSLSDLINDLMVFARPRPPKLSLFDVVPLLADAVLVARRDPAAQHLDISVRGDAVAITADAELVRSAVLNLLLNAGQAMNGQGRVLVTVTRAGEQAHIAIRDSGPGIPAEIRDRVFEAFFTTKARGGGLGLAIARRTAELHGGSLTLDCPEDGGTLATLTLPLRPPVTTQESDPARVPEARA